MSRPSDGRRQQADIGEHREAAADAGVVIEHGDAVRARAGRAGRCACRRPGGSVRPRTRSGIRASSPPSLSAPSTAMVCISVSPVPPDFEIATKRVVGERQPLPAASPKVSGSRLSRKCRRGASRSAPRPGTAWPAQLRQRLAAEARAAGAEEDEIGRAVAQQGGATLESRRGRRAAPADRRSGSEPSACRARIQSSAAALRSSASSSAAASTPWAPMRSARACRWIAEVACRLTCADGRQCSQTRPALRESGSPRQLPCACGRTSGRTLNRRGRAASRPWAGRRR